MTTTNNTQTETPSNPYATDLYRKARYAQSEEALLVALDKLNEESPYTWTGEYVETRLGPSTRLKWLPQVGDAVSYSINSDTCDEGVVVKASKARFTTSTGRVFTWSQRYYNWCPKGSPAHYHSAHARTETKRDPHY